MRRPIERLTLDRPDGTVELPLHVPSPIRRRPSLPTGCCSAPRRIKPQSAAPWLERLCTPQTRVAVLQNGIDHVARVAPLANGATVLPVIVYYNGERLAPDRVRMRRAAERIWWCADDAAGRAFAATVRGHRLRVFRSDDFVTLVWRKLLINAVANPITALTLQRQAVLRRPDIQELCHAVLDEAVAVGARRRRPACRTTNPRGRSRRCSRFPASSAPRCISIASPAARSKSRR